MIFYVLRHRSVSLVTAFNRLDSSFVIVSKFRSLFKMMWYLFENAVGWWIAEEKNVKHAPGTQVEVGEEAGAWYKGKECEGKVIFKDGKRYIWEPLSIVLLLSLSFKAITHGH